MLNDNQHPTSASVPSALTEQGRRRQAILDYIVERGEGANPPTTTPNVSERQLETAGFGSRRTIHSDLAWLRRKGLLGREETGRKSKASRLAPAPVAERASSRESLHHLFSRRDHALGPTAGLVHRYLWSEPGSHGPRAVARAIGKEAGQVLRALVRLEGVGLVERSGNEWVGVCGCAEYCCDKPHYDDAAKGLGVEDDKQRAARLAEVHGRERAAYRKWRKPARPRMKKDRSKLRYCAATTKSGKHCVRVAMKSSEVCHAHGGRSAGKPIEQWASCGHKLYPEHGGCITPSCPDHVSPCTHLCEVEGIYRCERKVARMGA